MDSPFPSVRVWLTTSVVALLCSSCGLGTGAVVSGLSGGAGAANGQPVGSTLLVPRSATSPAPILFVLTDQEGDKADVEIGFRTDSSASFRPITLTPGSAPLTGVRASTAPYSVEWDFDADLGGAGYRAGIEIQLTVKGGISPPVLPGVTQGNDAPQILSAMPSRGTAAEYSGNVDVTFVLADSAADVVKVRVEYNNEPGDFPESAWQLARPAATPASEGAPDFAIVGFEPTAAGREGTFRWDTAASPGLADFDANVKLRFTPADPFATGVPVTTDEFLIDNNAPPQAVLEGDEFSLGIKDRGRIPVPLLLFDQESDLLDVLVQWRRSGQGFPALPPTPADLRDLIQNPSRAAERQQRQIAVEAPLAFSGRVGAVAGVGLAANQIRLPEVADTAAGVLAYDIAGRTLEILRATTIPQPVAWSPNPLSGPVAAVPSAAGNTALVLDSSGSGWRVLELDLETGLETGAVRPLATGAGLPRALVIDPSGARLFVGSTAGLFRIDRFDGTSLGSVAHDFGDGPRGLAALGADVAVATGDDRLVRCDFTTSSTSTLLDGLGEPWGVVADPLEEGSVYLAERSINRVSAVDLDELRPRALAARVAPADVPTLGSIPLPSPRALALENRGSRLLVMTEFAGGASLRTVELRSPTDFDGAAGADPFVREVTRQLGEPQANVAAGPDRLRVVCLPVANLLALAGGVSQRRTIVERPQPPGSGPEPYAARTQVVTLAENLDPLPAAGTPWRIQVPVRGLSGPAGRRHTFSWETANVPDGERVQLRILPIDGDVGTAATATQFKPIRQKFDLSQRLQQSDGQTAVAAADLDGDGDLDLVTTDFFDNALGLFFQTAPGAFTAGTSTLPTGVEPRSVAAADLNGDGKLDLVSANAGSDSLKVFFQGTPGAFLPPLTLTLAAQDRPTSVTVADLNGDGKLDIVSANVGASTLKLFFQGASAGTFGPGPSRTLMLAAGDSPEAVAAADLNGDGNLDLVSANNGSLTLKLFFQTATPGVFPDSADRVLETGTSPHSVAAADLDGDGNLDLVSAGNGELRLYYQTAPGDFVPGANPVPTGGDSFTVAAADLDGDGRLDLVSAIASGAGREALTLFLQTPPASPKDEPNFIAAAPIFTNGIPRSVAAADLDGDGDVDVAVVNEFGSFAPGCLVFLQTAPRAFTAALNPLITNLRNTDSVAAADLDGDGDIDLFAVGDQRDQKLFLQTAPGVFTADADPLPTRGGNRVAGADLDGDGDVDIATCEPGSLSLFTQTAPGVFSAGAIHSPSPFPGMRAVAVADLDGDGDVDLVTADSNQNRLAVYFQDALGVFSFASPLELGTGANTAPFSVAAADLNGDGFLDLVSANSGTSTLTVFFQTPPVPPATRPTFSPPDSYVSGSGPTTVVAADLDDDGDIDLVSADLGGNTLTLFFQRMPGMFIRDPNPLQTGRPGSVVAVDLDSDGDLDLASANSFFGGGSLTLFFQLAPGVFRAGASPLPTGILPVDVAAADLDSDGDIDLVSTNTDGRNMSVFFGGR